MYRGAAHVGLQPDAARERLETLQFFQPGVDARGGRHDKGADAVAAVEDPFVDQVADAGEDLVVCRDAEDMFRKLGI